MSSQIHGINFDNQVVSAKDHGRMFQCLLTDGILTGCTMSYSGKNVTIGTGYLLVAGREMKLTSTATVSVAGATTGYARVVVTLDLSKEASTTNFEQANFSVSYASTATGFPALAKDDVNNTGTKYEFEMCTVRLTTTGVSGFYRRASAARNAWKHLSCHSQTGKFQLRHRCGRSCRDVCRREEPLLVLFFQCQ